MQHVSYIIFTLDGYSYQNSRTCSLVIAKIGATGVLSLGISLLESQSRICSLTLITMS